MIRMNYTKDGRTAPYLACDLCGEEITKLHASCTMWIDAEEAAKRGFAQPQLIMPNGQTIAPPKPTPDPICVIVHSRGIGEGYDCVNRYEELLGGKAVMTLYHNTDVVAFWINNRLRPDWEEVGERAEMLSRI